MRHLIIIYISLLTSQPLFPQNQASIWYLGNGNGVDFSTTPPQILNNAPNATEAYHTFSDLDGNLLAYCNRTTVWNAKNEIMINGSNLGGGLGQNVLLMPRPGHDYQFYIFQVVYDYNTFSGSSESKLIYSLVDVSINEVVIRNRVLYRRLHGSFTVSGNSELGYGLVGESDTNLFTPTGTDEIYAFRIDENSIAPAPVVSTPVNIGNSGYYRLSPNGEKLFFAYEGSAYGSEAPSVIADFNLVTGKVSNLNIIDPDVGQGEFSPDGNLLYVISWPGQGVKLTQYNLNDSSYQGTEIALLPSMFDINLAPNGKIYLNIGSSESLGVINNPNNIGLACDFSLEDNLNFPNSLLNAYLQTSVAYLLHDNPIRVDAGSDQEVCSGERVQIGGINPSLTEFEWFPKEYLDDPYTNNPNFIYDNPYDSSVIFRYILKSCASDQVIITVHPNLSPKIYGSRSVCPKAERIDYWTDYDDNYAYNWEVEGGEIIIGHTNDSIQVNWGPTNPIAKVKLIATNQFNCISKESVFDVRVNVELETETPKGEQKICDNNKDNYTYEIVATRGSIYTWEVEGGSIIYGQGSNAVIVNWIEQVTNWIRVHEESTTIDTICYGVSPKHVVTIYKDTSEIILNYVTVNPLNYTDIQIFGGFKNRDDKSNFPFELLQKQVTESSWTLISSGLSNSDTIKYNATELFPHEYIYEYYFRSVNGCFESIQTSKHNSIKLGISNSSNGKKELTWNPYIGWPDGVLLYELYRKVDYEDQLKYIGNVSNNVTSLLIENEKDGFLHNYVVKAISKNQNVFSWSNTITVEYDHPLFIPNVFTPNNDGINDSFMIDPIQLYPKNELVIFNRLGGEVYRKNGYNNEWRAKGVLSGIYFYRLYIDKDQQSYTGWVQVLR